jgi:hypothetical protein
MPSPSVSEVWTQPRSFHLSLAQEACATLYATMLSFAARFSRLFHCFYMTVEIAPLSGVTPQVFSF